MLWDTTTTQHCDLLSQSFTVNWIIDYATKNPVETSLLVMIHSDEEDALSAHIMVHRSDNTDKMYYSFPKDEKILHWFKDLLSSDSLQPAILIHEQGCVFVRGFSGEEKVCEILDSLSAVIDKYKQEKREKIFQ